MELSGRCVLDVHRSEPLQNPSQKTGLAVPFASNKNIYINVFHSMFCREESKKRHEAKSVHLHQRLNSAAKLALCQSRIATAQLTVHVQLMAHRCFRRSLENAKLHRLHNVKSVKAYKDVQVYETNRGGV